MRPECLIEIGEKNRVEFADAYTEAVDHNERTCSACALESRSSPVAEAGRSALIREPQRTRRTGTHLGIRDIHRVPLEGVG